MMGLGALQRGLRFRAFELASRASWTFSWVWREETVDGTIRLDAGVFEAFFLPQYAEQPLTDDYKSDFVNAAGRNGRPPFRPRKAEQPS